MRTGKDKPRGLVSLNGELVPAGEAMVSVFDRGFAFGDGLVETLKLIEGRPVFFKEHYIRLSSGMEAAGMAPPPPVSELWRRCVGLAEENSLAAGRLRLQVTRGVAQPGEGPEPGAGYEPTMIITAQAFGGHPERFYQEGMTCITVPADRGAFAALKTSSLMTTVMARRQAAAAGADESIFTSGHGTLLEGAYTNIFFLGEGGCFTTPASEHILPGITREKVIGVLASLDIAVVERSIRLEDIPGVAQAGFLSGSLLGFCPMRRIDSRALAPDRELAGRVDELLQQLERESVSETYG